MPIRHDNSEAAMKWSDQLPTAPGIYWTKDRRPHSPSQYDLPYQLVLLYGTEDGLAAQWFGDPIRYLLSDEAPKLRRYGVQWAGPLPVPEA